MKKEDLIDPKNPHTVGRSFANLGNHPHYNVLISLQRKNSSCSKGKGKGWSKASKEKSKDRWHAC